MTLGAVGLFVKDLETMTCFYRDTMKLKQNLAMEGFSGFETKDGFFLNLCDRSFIEGASSKPLSYVSGFNGGMQLTFNVATDKAVDETYKRLRKAGVTAIMAPTTKPYGLREAYVADPEGNLIEIVAPVDDL